MSKLQDGSRVRLTVSLPRIVRRGSKVAHVLIHPAAGDWDGSDSACHGIDFYEDDLGDGFARWASVDDPTCKKCLAALRRWVDAEEA